MLARSSMVLYDRLNGFMNSIMIDHLVLFVQMHTSVYLP